MLGIPKILELIIAIIDLLKDYQVKLQLFINDVHVPELGLVLYDIINGLILVLVLKDD